MGILGGHPAVVGKLIHFRYASRVGDGHDQLAAAKTQIEKLGDIGPLFQEDVFAHHAQVGRSVLHISGHIRRLGQDIFQLPLPIDDDQAAGLGPQELPDSPASSQSSINCPRSLPLGTAMTSSSIALRLQQVREGHPFFPPAPVKGP